MTATPQSNATLEEIADALAGCGSLVVCGHVNPDGDCVGSTLALGAALRSIGKDVACLLASEGGLGSSLESLPGADSLVAAADYAGPLEAFVAVDVPTADRLGEAAAALHARAALTVTVDHHAVDSRLSDMSFTDPDAASTTMLVWELARLLGAELSPQLAQCAYTGLMTDTGGFRFQNADAAAFRAAADMVEHGADPARAAAACFQNRSLASYRLGSAALSNLRLLDGGIALSFLSLADKEAAGAVRADAEPVIDDLRSISGVRVACLLREQDGSVRGSIRAKDGTDVSRIARMFGGGGHVAAAGFTIEAPLAEVVETLARVLPVEAGAVA